MLSSAVINSYGNHCVLIMLCQHRYHETRALLKEGRFVDTSDAEGNTLLMLACREGHGRLVKLMLRKGARLDTCNVQHKTAEQLALDNNHSGIVKFLQESSDAAVSRLTQ